MYYNPLGWGVGGDNMSMEKIIAEMFEKKSWAVVGATQNPSKFGNKIFKKLQRNGYDVAPINPVYDDVEGVATFENLSAMSEKPECVNVVVSPERAMNALNEAIELGIKYIWFQPGAFNEEIIERAETAGVNIVYHACVLVELDKI